MSDRPAQIEISHRSESHCTVATLSGQIDMRSSPNIRERLLGVLEEHPSRLVLDLSNVSYMDSSGVGTMVDVKRRLDRNGGKLVLAGLQPRVQSILEITRLTEFFTIADSVDEACAG